MKLKFILLLTSAILTSAQAQISKIKDKTVREDIEFADKQLQIMLNETDNAISQAKTSGKSDADIAFSPRNIEQDGSLHMVKPRDWTSGFFPGILWYMYEESKDDFWKEKAITYTNYLESIKSYKGTHDLGFMTYCSFGNGLRLANVSGYKEILLESARSLASRFDPKVGCIRSWDHNKNKWQYPVIIDNMMNLELLFWASKVSGDNTFKDIAIKHANTTMANHFRPDYSTYHVVDYNAAGDGKAIQFQTHQGYADSSAWARGQAWGLYGYTMCFRETGDKRYLLQAENIANFILTNPNMPEDFIPYWDFDAPDIPSAPRDVSAATIIASALYELSTMSEAKGKIYKETADKIVKNITTKYLSKPGEQHGFITISSVGHLPANSEINVPIIYSDYYFIEALVRKERLAEGKSVVE